MLDGVGAPLRKKYDGFKRDLRKGIRVLRQEGMRTFFRKFKRYLLEPAPEREIDEIQENKYLYDLATEQVTREQNLQRGTVDIIVPIYNSYDETKVCLESVLANSSDCRLILINDASPDDRIPSLMDDIADQAEDDVDVVTIQNDENKGFIETVNTAYEHTENHFAILNTDTKVPPGWLDRLFAPILAHPEIGSVTPFSNSATLCSFPEFQEDNDIFNGLSVETIDSYFARYAPSEPIDITTGVGFCMAFNKEVVEDIGLFASDVFDRGYGEENDWSMRAEKKGYRNVIAPNLFVYHEHGASFGEERDELQQRNMERLLERHPKYMDKVRAFNQRDPLYGIRETLRILIDIKTSDNPVYYVFGHTLGGGSELYADNLTDSLATDAIVIDLRYDYHTGCHVFDYQGDGTDTTFLLPERGPEAFDAMMSLLGSDYVFVNQLVSWPTPLDYARTIASHDVDYTLFAHDFFSICPSWHLLNEKREYCGIPEDLDRCQQCIDQNRKAEFTSLYLDEHRNFDIQEWRSAMGMLLDGATQIVAFSEDTAEKVQRSYDSNFDITVAEHALPWRDSLEWGHRTAETPLTIAVLGSIGDHKGRDIIRDLVKDDRFDELPVRIVVVGQLQEYPPHDGENLIVTGEFERDELNDIYEQYDVSLTLIPSIWPETFSYTTSESLLMGYLVMCFDIGAPADRVREYDCGVVLQSTTVDSILDELESLCANPYKISRLSEHTENYTPPSWNEHLAEAVPQKEVPQIDV
jgi:GT2 family glycosyltransferase